MRDSSHQPKMIMWLFHQAIKKTKIYTDESEIYHPTRKGFRCE